MYGGLAGRVQSVRTVLDTCGWVCLSFSFVAACLSVGRWLGILFFVCVLALDMCLSGFRFGWIHLIHRRDSPEHGKGREGGGGEGGKGEVRRELRGM